MSTSQTEPMQVLNPSAEIEPTNARQSYFPPQLLFLWAASFVVAGIVVGGLAWSSTPDPKAGESERETVNQWLEEQRKGNSGSVYWTADTVEPAKLFAVRSWEIIDVSHDRVTVRVDSSNQGGQQITVLWKVYLQSRMDGPKKVIRFISKN